jgi:hypothetical protein
MSSGREGMSMVIVTIVSACLIMDAILGFGKWFVNRVFNTIPKN